MKMSNKVYNILKYALMMFIPAVITLIGTLGKIYNFDTETIILTISAIATFVGAITGISNVNYNKNNKQCYNKTKEEYIMNTKSSLATSDIQACVGNYTEGRNGKKIS